MKTWPRLIGLTANILLLLGSIGFAADAMPTRPAATATAIFAGGCFWCLEADFEKLPGVIGAESGYTGGKTPNPTYHQVSAGGTGHTEAVRVSYDPAKVSYQQLVDYFWRHIDPTVKGSAVLRRRHAVSQWHLLAERGRTQDRRSKPRRAAEKRQAAADHSRKSSPPRRSTLPRNITRTTTRKTRSAMPTIAKAAAGMRGCMRSGATSGINNRAA